MKQMQRKWHTSTGNGTPRSRLAIRVTFQCLPCLPMLYEMTALLDTTQGHI